MRTQITYVTRKELIGSWESGSERLSWVELVVMVSVEMTGKRNLVILEATDLRRLEVGFVFELELFWT